MRKGGRMSDIYEKLDGLFHFERNKELKYFEDEFMIYERDEEGRITFTGKPFKPVFIYEVKEDV